MVGKWIALCIVCFILMILFCFVPCVKKTTKEDSFLAGVLTLTMFAMATVGLSEAMSIKEAQKYGDFTDKMNVSSYQVDTLVKTLSANGVEKSDTTYVILYK